MKKKIVISSTIIVVLVIVLFLIFGLRYLPFFSSNDESSLDNYDEAIKLMNEDFPTELFLLGPDNMHFRESVNYTLIDEITKENLETKKEYRAIIINDFENNLDISLEELEFLKTELEKDYKFSFFYFGTKEVKNFESIELIKFGDITKDDLCTAISTYFGDRVVWGGIYAKSDHEIAMEYDGKDRMAQFAIEHLGACYKSNME